MTVRYEAPSIVDYGSITEHTFTTCGGSGMHPSKPGKKPVPKGPMSPTTHFDKFGECSETRGDGGGGGGGGLS